MTDPATSFSELSAVLIGEVSVAASTADRHLATLRSHFGEAQIESLLARFNALKAQPGNLCDAVAAQIIGDAELGPIARSMLSLWFAGMVDVTAVPAVPPTGADYVEALMWTTVGAHAPGNSDGYYGHWRYPPDTGV